MLNLTHCWWPCVPVLVAGACSAERVDYVRQVKPILAARCYACHGARKQESGLRVDTAALLKQGGESGAAIVPGKSGESLLIMAVVGSGEVVRMPVQGKPLDEGQIDLLKKWIEQGAEAPDEPTPTDPGKRADSGKP
jgi:mono/diheme cytochrome c family protein